MDACCIILIVIFGLFLLGILVISWKYYQATRARPIPKLDINEYWGPGDVAKYEEDSAIRLAPINYDENVISELRVKLSEDIPFHPPLEGIQEEYGINRKTLTDFIAYWRDVYLPKWSERQDFFNSVPHYETQIQG